MTTINDSRPDALPPLPLALATGEMTVRQLVAELARAEDALRERPDDREATQRLRLLVRALRRRRARLRLQALRLPHEPFGGRVP